MTPLARMSYLDGSLVLTRSIIRPLQGESEKQVLRAFTLKNAARQVDNPELAKVGDKRGHLSGSDSEGFGPFFWVVLSVASVLVSASVVLALVIRTRCFMGRGSEAAAAIGRPLGERRRPFENPKKKRRRSSASTMRFPRHEMEVGGRGKVGNLFNLSLIF